jgi:N-acetylglucosamine-6-phosphate deacetylase
MTSHGYFDLQVNGYAGVDFNAPGLTAESLHAACQRLQAEGVAGILATVITEEVPVMCDRLSRLAGLRAADPLAAAIVRGFHIEGPFISPVPGYVGAHPIDATRPADVQTMDRLLDAAQGLTRLVTLAPEADPQQRVIAHLANRNIRISAGHTDASLDQLRAALDAGLTLFTHLGNGCPMQMARHDNIIQRVLHLADRFWPMFIADGAHVPFYVLANYLHRVGLDRAIVVTDAISAAGNGPGTYQLARHTVKVGEDLVVRSADGTHLVGSAGPMPHVVLNLREQLHLSDGQITKLLVTNPRTALGMKD